MKSRKHILKGDKIMRLKLTYIKGHSYVIECDKYEVFKKKLWYKKGFDERLWDLKNILKIEEV